MPWRRRPASCSCAIGCHYRQLLQAATLTPPACCAGLQGPAALRRLCVQQKANRRAGRQPAGAWAPCLPQAARCLPPLILFLLAPAAAAPSTWCPTHRPTLLLACPHAHAHSPWTSPPPLRRVRSTCFARRRWPGSRAPTASCRRWAGGHLSGRAGTWAAGQQGTMDQGASSGAAHPALVRHPPCIAPSPCQQVLRVREMLKRGVGVHHAGERPGRTLPLGCAGTAGGGTPRRSRPRRHGCPRSSHPTQPTPLHPTLEQACCPS